MKYLCLLLALFVVTGCGPQISRLQQEKRDGVFSYTPPPTQTAAPSPRPVPASVSTPDILIDPGHGGKDLGTHSEGKVFYEEKSAALMTSKLVGRRLTEMGYNVSFTRRDDSFIDLKQRVHFSELRRPRIFVSIHYNAAPTPKADGIEIFYFKGEKEDIRSRASKLLAQDVLNSVIDTTKARSRGVKNGNLHVIRENPRPAILIEAGFLTNKEERQHIYSKSYQEKLAQGIADGIDKYLQRNAQKAVKIGVGY